MKHATKASSLDAEKQGSEGLSYLSGTLTEARSGGGAAAGALRTATNRLVVDDQVQLGAPRQARRRRMRTAAEPEEVPELVRDGVRLPWARLLPA